ncbi:MAG: hypothetical protein ABIQ86_12945 [Steroidobacteraceae bacterium]
MSRVQVEKRKPMTGEQFAVMLAKLPPDVQTLFARLVHGMAEENRQGRKTLSRRFTALSKRRFGAERRLTEMRKMLDELNPL